MRIAYVIAIAGGIVAAAIIAILASSIPTRDYALDVDALKDQQSLFVYTRIVLKNVGREPLTNVIVDYGNMQEPPIAVMQPGERRDISPPGNADLNQVTVTADNGIKVVKEYRSPIKLPGMMGS